MDFSTMKKKIDTNEYQSVEEYKVSIGALFTKQLQIHTYIISHFLFCIYNSSDLVYIIYLRISLSFAWLKPAVLRYNIGWFEVDNRW